ncbi:MAG: efflux RND transporter periplasmic adaptor subunit [Roseburia sp.]|nr:efflux RND transporter periplasmic adaptor subunit [Roseburia sp.]MCM1097102.1 efflux RND transporter periplasmic adaptor subunit [Ruminococcus flavefaciens]
MRRQIIKHITAAILLSALLCGCGQEEEGDRLVMIEQEEQGPDYQFAVATVGDIEKTTRVSCTYTQLKDQPVSFDWDGKIVEKVYVEEGDTVKKGDLLAALAGDALADEIERLEYTVARTELLLSYLETDEAYDISDVWLSYLYRSGQSEYDAKNRDNSVKSIQQSYRYRREDYEDTLEMDRKQLEEYRKEERQSRVYAAMDGTVYQMKENLEGSTTEKGEVVMTIVDNSQCVFETEAQEYADRIPEGAEISMNVSYGTGAGQYVLTPWNREEWGEKQFFSVLEGPSGEGVEVGAKGTMVIVLERREQVLNVPLLAVSEAEGKSFVYVVGQDNMREIKWIETGLYGDSAVEVTSGLAEGDKVILR